MNTQSPLVLVIDDDDDLRTTMCEYLQNNGYQTYEAENGAHALSLIKDKIITPPLVITDIFMPEKDGLETIVEMKNFLPNLKILAVSAGGTSWVTDVLEIAKSLGAEKVLSKPFEFEELLDSIKVILPAN